MELYSHQHGHGGVFQPVPILGFRNFHLGKPSLTLRCAGWQGQQKINDHQNVGQ